MMKNLFIRSTVLLPLLMIFSFSFAQKTPQQLEASRKKISANPTVQSVKFSEELKTPSIISFKPGSQNKATVVPAMRNYFELSASNEIRLKNSTNSKNNIVVDRYKQFYKGIPVEHSAYIVLSKEGIVHSITAESYPITESFSISPSKSVDAARNTALNFAPARKYVWDALEEDKNRYPGNTAMQEKLEALKQKHYPKGELVIAKDVYGDGQAHLAYKFDVYAAEPLSRYKIYVDAQTGKILLRDAVIKHAQDKKSKTELDPENKLANYQFYGLGIIEDIPQANLGVTASELGTGQTRYSGTRNIYTTKVIVPSGGTKPDPNDANSFLSYSGIDPRVTVVGPATVFILKDQTRGEGIETYDMNGVGGLPLSVPGIHGQALAFVDKNNIWENDATNGTSMEDLIRGADNAMAPPGVGAVGGGAEEANNDDIALDAHWGAEMVYDYWSKRHNRASFDNLNSAIKSYVHYGPAYDNAFWNGSVMTYGDGSGAPAGFKPLVSLDVCAHEVGHGVCSFTSDLVYESESGAMNEGLSDIWAAAQENFVNDSIDNTLPYQYFQIGEHIDPLGVGIRRIDNPKAKTDPDTYGGRYWANPDCTPTLANDQCGVHTNSGVLNKWYYLAVKGAQQTTGVPAVTDDGMADRPRTTPDGTNWVENAGNNYSIAALPGLVGLGHEQAEDIIYLMEQMLTPNATFLDARNASISAAVTLYGVCSKQEKTITNAWYAVNVGASFGVCTAPLLSVNPSVVTIGEGAPGDCPRFKDVKMNSNLIDPQLSSTVVTFTVTGGTLGAHEYQIINPIITYNIGEFGLRSTPVIRIFDDAVVEPDETVEITASSASPSYSNTFTITVKDNDPIPTIGGIDTLLFENFESTANGTITTGWDTIPKTIPSPVRWGMETENASPILHWTGKRAIIELKPPGAVNNGKALYDQNVSAQTILRTPLINGLGLDSLKLKFTYSAGGEPACTPACDYGQVMYSYDGINYNSMFAEDVALYAQLTDAQAQYAIPQHLSNKQFYIGFKWHNDANAGLSASITIDNVLITGRGKLIATDAMSGVSEPIPSIAQESNRPSYLYSLYDATLLSKIVNASQNLGCVKDTLSQSGVGYVPFNGGVRTKKVHQITPSQNPNSSYTLTLYYVNEELAGIDPMTLRLLKSNAPTIDASTGSNSIIVTPIIGNHSAEGYWSYTYTFTGFSYFALVSQAVSFASPDLTPRISLNPNNIIGPSPLEITVLVSELNNNPTDGTPITLYVNKLSYFSNFSFNPAQPTNIAGEPLNNSEFTIDAVSNPNFYIIRTSAIFQNSGKRVAFNVTADPGQSKGSTPVNVYLQNGSGGEINSTNNSHNAILTFSF